MWLQKDDTAIANPKDHHASRKKSTHQHTLCLHPTQAFHITIHGNGAKAVKFALSYLYNFYAHEKSHCICAGFDIVFSDKPVTKYKKDNEVK